MAQVWLTPIADKIAASSPDNRNQPNWESALWERCALDHLDTTQVDILFDMVVRRWDRAVKSAP